MNRARLFLLGLLAVCVFSGVQAASSSTCQGSATKPPHCDQEQPEARMGRLWTSGLEWKDFTAEGASQLGTGNSFSNTQVRSGSWAITGSGVNDYRFTNYTATLGVTYYLRAYVYLTATPVSNVAVLDLGGGQARVRVNTDGTATVTYTTSFTVLGTSSFTVPLNTWVRFELAFGTGAGSTDYVEALIDGVSIGSASNLNITDTPLARASVFLGDGTNASYADDIALNDSSGANQNTWPGSGKEVLLRPISDNARGANWVGGAGGTTNLFDALDNQPPVGVAIGSATNTSQIKNVTKDTTGNYDANLTSYSTAGIKAFDTIKVVQPSWTLSETGTAISHAMLLVSNPAANGGTESTASISTTAGTHPTGWSWQSPSAQTVYNPSVTLGTSPVLRIGKRTSSTSPAEADAMGVYVDYVPGGSLVYESRRVARNSMLRR